MSQQGDNSDKMESDILGDDDVQTSASQEQTSVGQDTDMGAAGTSGNQAEIKYSNEALQHVTSKLSSGAFHALNTSWPALTSDQQSAFLTSSVR